MSASFHIVGVLLVMVVLMLVSGCGTTPPEPPEALEDVIITGTATYRERMALPEDAVLAVRLLDITTADVSLEIAWRRIPLEGRQPPFPFELIVPAQRINPTHLYSVSVAVMSGVDPMFESGLPRPVLTHGAPAHVDLVMRHVGDEQAAPLTETRWEAFELNGGPIDESDLLEPPYLVLHFESGRFSGSTGLNQFGGGYELAGAALAFTPGPMTKRGGSPEAMRLERELLAALNRVDGWALHTNTLTLRAGDQAVMRLVAAAPQSR